MRYLLSWSQRWLLLAAGAIALLPSCAPPSPSAPSQGQLELAFPGETGPWESAEIETPAGPLLLTFQWLRGERVLEGDILLPEPSRGPTQADTHPLGAAIHGSRRWPLGVIPYAFRWDLPQETQNEVNAAIAHWHQRTGIRLVPRTTESDYVLVQPGAGCSSSLGRVGGAQALTLAPECDTGSAIHEIGHAAGLFHEQSRADRDGYVTIQWQNIQPGMEHNFRTYRESGWTGYWDGSDMGGYDLGSIMQYPSWAFSSNGQATITTRTGGWIEAQRVGLSGGDVAAINELYEGSAPALARLDDVRLARVIRRPDTGLSYSEWNGTAWSPEFDLGGWARSSPAIASSSPNRVDVFVVGTEHAVWHRARVSGVWGAWESLGGYATSAPSAIAWSGGRLDVFVRGADNAIYQSLWQGAGWSQWWYLGGQATSAPSAINWPDGRIDIYIRGTDGAIYQKLWPPGAPGWSQWWYLGGDAASAPAALAWPDGRIDIFIRGRDGAIYQKLWPPGAPGWSQWWYLGGQGSGAPAVAQQAGYKIHVMARGQDGGLWQRSWTGPEWTAWFSLGQALY